MLSNWMRNAGRVAGRTHTFDRVGRIENGVDRAVYALAFSQDGKRLACGGTYFPLRCDSDLS